MKWFVSHMIKFVRILIRYSFKNDYEIDGNNFDGPLPTEIGELESVVKIEIGKS